MSEILNTIDELIESARHPVPDAEPVYCISLTLEDWHRALRTWGYDWPAYLVKTILRPYCECDLCTTYWFWERLGKFRLGQVLFLAATPPVVPQPEHVCLACRIQPQGRDGDLCDVCMAELSEEQVEELGL